MATIVEARSVYKKFRGATVLRGVSLRVGEGEVVGLVGPNGAGKTTLLRVLLGILRRDGGEVWLAGRDPWRDPRARERVGVVFERPSLPSSVPLINVLERAARIKGVSPREARRVIREAGLAGHEWKPFRALSAGLKQRAAIAHALLGDPQVLVADEPTSNLDPVERARILDFLSVLNRDRGITILVSSHVLPEVVRVASKLIVLVGGRVKDAGTPEEVLGGLRLARVRAGDPDGLARFLEEMGFKVSLEGVSVLVESPVQGDLFEALAEASRRGLQVYNVDFVEPGLMEELSSGG
ncbi:MAG: ABC transporter ATP-binding protein [Desulfurococcales archaeon]|nr:ABC transporter ATP-binding protein [Desulfurococcales archaeon]